MRLWSFQTTEMVEKLRDGKTLFCNPMFSTFFEDREFLRSYSWIVEQMENRVPKPEDAVWPIWAWHTQHGLQKKPDRRRYMFRDYSDKDSIVEFEIPESEVLLSDFDDWHNVLNNFPILSEREFEEWTPRDSEGYPIVSEEFKTESWKKIFHTTGDFVQACVWSIPPESVIKVHSLKKKLT